MRFRLITRTRWKPKVGGEGRQESGKSFPTPCAAQLYGQIPPSKEHGQGRRRSGKTFDITFRAPRGEKRQGEPEGTRDRGLEMARRLSTTREIPNGTALDPGPQFCFKAITAKVSFRNIKIKPLKLAESGAAALPMTVNPLIQVRLPSFRLTARRLTRATLLEEGAFSTLVPIGAMKVSINMPKVVGKEETLRKSQTAPGY